MVNRNDVTLPSDSINKLKSKKTPDLSPDANAKSGVGDNPKFLKKSKLPPAPTPDLTDKSGGRIGKDPTENF